MNKKKKSKRDNHFVNYCLDLLSPAGPVDARAMFGGYGLYRDRLIFGLIADDCLYFKVDDHNKDAYLSHGAKPFVYTKAGKQHTMSYYEVPIAVLEDPEQLCIYVDEACAATRRSKHH